VTVNTSTSSPYIVFTQPILFVAIHTNGGCLVLLFHDPINYQLFILTSKHINYTLYTICQVWPVFPWFPQPRKYYFPGQKYYFPGWSRFKGNKSRFIRKRIWYLFNVWLIIDIFMIVSISPLLAVWFIHFYLNFN